jgi:hypothetical protein
MDELDYIKDVAMDSLDEGWFIELMNMAEQAGGTIGVTSEGRLVIAGSNVDALALQASDPFEYAHVEALGVHVLGFKF